jgi:hypothetical protein
MGGRVRLGTRKPWLGRSVAGAASSSLMPHTTVVFPCNHETVQLIRISCNLCVLVLTGAANQVQSSKFLLDLRPDVTNGSDSYSFKIFFVSKRPFPQKLR